MQVKKMKMQKSKRMMRWNMEGRIRGKEKLRKRREMKEQKRQNKRKFRRKRRENVVECETAEKREKDEKLNKKKGQMTENLEVQTKRR